MRALHWFRNDLRLRDNAALAAAAAGAESLVTVFVYDERLLAANREAAARLGYLEASLGVLARALRAQGSALLVETGDPRRVVPALARRHGCGRVTWNRDYTPYARTRDAAVAAALGRAGVDVVEAKDRVVWEGHEIRTRAGGPFTVFTPYRRAWWSRLAAEPLDPAPIARAPRLPPAPPEARAAEVPAPGASPHLPVGEAAALERLERFLDGPVGAYATARDLPAEDGTSRLSPYLRWGQISVRACLDRALALQAAEPRLAPGIAKWMDELVWREFYHAVESEFPRVHRGAFRPEYDALAWENRRDWFEAWCRGETGFPFVDAGMRQLNDSGWMHNRARMVVASFLTKDLLIDWRWGERYFKERLLDWDPASNNGGWQWAASTGTDAQPYFRIFNPMTQGERHDPTGAYVRRWVAELADAPREAVHRPWAAGGAGGRYPERIVDHAAQRAQALARYQAARDARS